MNKIAFAFVLLLSAGASAADIRPYAGLDISRLSAGFNEGNEILEDAYNAFTMNFGAKINTNFGAEFFYKQTGEKTTGDLVLIATGTPVEAETSFSGFGFAANGYVPLAAKLSFEPSLGLGLYRGKLTLCDASGSGYGCVSDKDDSTLGITFGVGLAYAVAENADLRGGFRYTAFDDEDFSLEDFTELYLGARYVF